MNGSFPIETPLASVNTSIDPIQDASADTGAMREQTVWRHPVRLARRALTLFILAAVILGLAGVALMLADGPWWWIPWVSIMLFSALGAEALVPARVVATERELVFTTGWRKRRFAWERVSAVEAVPRGRWFGQGAVDLVVVHEAGARVEVPEFRLWANSRRGAWGGEQVAAEVTPLARNFAERRGSPPPSVS